MAAHLTISGTDRSRVDATRALAERHLDVVSFGDLLRSIEKQQTIRNQGRALIRAGVGAPPEFDKRLAKAIKKFLRSDDPVLREAALFTMSYVPAAQYRAFLDEAAQQDPDERLRQTARGILAAYDKGGVPR